jgi:hypothetical protein
LSRQILVEFKGERLMGMKGLQGHGVPRLTERSHFLGAHALEFLPITR